jgi:hypothetical protein
LITWAFRSCCRCLPSHRASAGTRDSGPPGPSLLSSSARCSLSLSVIAQVVVESPCITSTGRSDDGRMRVARIRTRVSGYSAMLVHSDATNRHASRDLGHGRPESCSSPPSQSCGNEQRPSVLDRVVLLLGCVLAHHRLLHVRTGLDRSTALTPGDPDSHRRPCSADAAVTLLPPSTPGVGHGSGRRVSRWHCAGGEVDRHHWCRRECGCRFR